jgi:hypothetical protein
MDIGADETCVDRKAFAADQPLRHAALNGHLEQLPQQIAVAEAAMPVLREGRVIRHRAIETEPAKPAIDQVQMHLLAQPPLRADAHAIADDQHADHQFGIDRGPSRLAVEWPQMLADAIEIDEAVDQAQQVIRRHMILNAEAVKQRFLHHRALAHHQQISREPSG